MKVIVPEKVMPQRLDSFDLGDLVTTVILSRQAYFVISANPHSPNKMATDLTTGCYIINQDRLFNKCVGHVVIEKTV